MANESTGATTLSKHREHLRHLPQLCCGHSLSEVDDCAHAVSLCECEDRHCACLETDLDARTCEQCERRVRAHNAVERENGGCVYHLCLECAPDGDAHVEQLRVERAMRRAA